MYFKLQKTPHCTLYTRVGWPSGILLSTKPFRLYYLFIWPFLLFRNVVGTEFGIRSFMYSAPSSWNSLQNHFQLEELVPIAVYQSPMKDFEADSLTCCI
jgi:hypothetical protein